MTAFLLLLLIISTSIAFNGMMFLMMVRVEDPLVPRAMFGVLNTLLFFPSGAISPVSGLPKWLQVIAHLDPFTYAVHGFKAILLKDGGFTAIRWICSSWLALVSQRCHGHAPVQTHAVANSH